MKLPRGAITSGWATHSQGCPSFRRTNEAEASAPFSFVINCFDRKISRGLCAAPESQHILWGIRQVCSGRYRLWVRWLNVPSYWTNPPPPNQFLSVILNSADRQPPQRALCWHSGPSARAKRCHPTPLTVARKGTCHFRSCNGQLNELNAGKGCVVSLSG